MSDRFEERLSNVGEPRALDAGFRRRLEKALTAGTLPEGSPGRHTSARWSIDGPRVMPERFRARLENRIASARSGGRPLRAWLAAAIAAVLVASSVVVVTQRTGASRNDRAVGALPAPGSSPKPAAAKPRGPGTLRTFSSARQ